MTAGATWLIVNPTSGGGRATTLASALVRRLGDRGIPVRLVQPGSAADTTDVARAAVSAGAGAVVACGGDGTVHDVVQALGGSSVPMGVLPAGSGDDVATSLGIRARDTTSLLSSLVAAIEARAAATIDTGIASTADGRERRFVGVLSTGFDSSVNERANRMGRLAGQRYHVAMLRELASFRARDYRVILDGTVVTGTGMLVTVGNSPRFGGGMLVCPDACMDDGLLDVTWLEEISKTAFLRLFPRVYRGTHVRHPSVRTYRARHLEIEAPGQIAYADGERVGPLPVSIRVDPLSLRVLTFTEAGRT